MADRQDSRFLVVIHDFAWPFCEELRTIVGIVRSLVGSQFAGGIVPMWHSTDAVGRPRGIAVPLLPGESLNCVLSRTDVSLKRKLNCIALALCALLLLHKRPAVWPDGQTRRLSHGDATAENVYVDDLQQCACWFDFDMRHRPDIPEVQRHADDLRALIFSSAVHLAADQYAQLAAHCSPGSQISGPARRIPIQTCRNQASPEHAAPCSGPSDLRPTP